MSRKELSQVGWVPVVDMGMGETQGTVSYLIQGLPVSFRQVLRLVVSHGPLTHHLGAEGGTSGSQDPSWSIPEPSTHLQA